MSQMVYLQWQTIVGHEKCFLVGAANDGDTACLKSKVSSVAYKAFSTFSKCIKTWKKMKPGKIWWLHKGPVYTVPFFVGFSYIVR